MIVTCKDCQKEYDDAMCWTLCPHEPLMPKKEMDQKMAAIALLEKRVRFAHEPEGSEGYFVQSVSWDGMVTIRGFSGEFAPHLFKVIE